MAYIIHNAVSGQNIDIERHGQLPQVIRTVTDTERANQNASRRQYAEAKGNQYKGDRNFTVAAEPYRVAGDRGGPVLPIYDQDLTVAQFVDGNGLAAFYDLTPDKQVAVHKKAQVLAVRPVDYDAQKGGARSIVHIAGGSSRGFLSSLSVPDMLSVLGDRARSLKPIGANAIDGYVDVTAFTRQPSALPADYEPKPGEKKFASVAHMGAVRLLFVSPPEVVLGRPIHNAHAAGGAGNIEKAAPTERPPSRKPQAKAPPRDVA